MEFSWGFLYCEQFVKTRRGDKIKCALGDDSGMENIKRSNMFPVVAHIKAAINQDFFHQNIYSEEQILLATLWKTFRFCLITHFKSIIYSL